MLSFEKEPRPTRLPKPGGSGNCQTRCLVIEDEADTARYICNGLKEEEFTIFWCRDRVDGLRRAADDGWDVIILDRMLPGAINGLSIIQAIRDPGKTTPVLILSALASLVVLRCLFLSQEDQAALPSSESR